MLSRKLLILFLIILFTVLQCTIVSYIQILKIKPDILLILIIFFSLYYGRTYGLVVGALCGLFSEATCGIPTGVAVFVYSLAGLILGHIGKWVYPALSTSEEILQGRKSAVFNQRIFGQMGITFIFSFLVYFFLFFLFRSSNINLPLFNTLISIILPASFYTACVSPFLFRFLKIILEISAKSKI